MFESRTASRAEISRATRLSKPTVNAAVELLIEQGYRTEDPGLASPSRPGRRPRLLRFESGLGYVLGIDIGANKVLVLVADLAGHVLATERRSTGAPETAALIALVEDAASRSVEAAGIPAGSLKAGDQLPTVRQLAVDLAINPNTVVRAYRELEIREVLATQQGTGTFITDKKPAKNDVERQRRVAQLAGELLARAGAEGITLQELLDWFTELQNEKKGRS